MAGFEVLVEGGDIDAARRSSAAARLGKGGIDIHTRLDHLVEPVGVRDLIATCRVQAWSENGNDLGSVVLQDRLHIDGVIVKAVSTTMNCVAGHINLITNSDSRANSSPDLMYTLSD